MSRRNRARVQDDVNAPGRAPAVPEGEADPNDGRVPCWGIVRQRGGAGGGYRLVSVRLPVEAIERYAADVSEPDVLEVVMSKAELAMRREVM